MSIAADLLVKLGADPSGLVAGMKTAENAVKSTKLSLGDLQALLKQLQNERPQIVDDAQLKQYNQTIATLKTNIKDLSNVGVAGFDDLGKKIGSTSGPLNEAYSGVRKLANILPGIGIGGLIAVGVEALAGALESLIPSLLGADAATQLVNHTLAQAAGSVAGETEGIKDLIGIVTNETAARKDRLTAFKELQEQYPNAFKNMSLEKTSLADLETATDKLTTALIRQAQIKGLESTISKISGEINELLASSTTEIIKSAGAIGVLKAVLSGGILGGAQFGANIVGDQIGEASDKLAKLKDQLKALITTSVSQGDNDILGKSVKTLPDTLAKTQEALKEIIKLQDELAKPNTQPLFERLAKSIDPSQAQLLETEITKVLRDNVKNGIDKAITDKEVGLMQEKLKRLVNPDLTTKIDTRVEVNPIVEGDVTTFERTFPPKLYELLGKLPPIKTDIKIDPSLIFDPKFGTKAGFEKFASTIEEGFTSAITGAIEKASQAIGELVAKGGVGNFLSALASILGNALKAIAQAYIAAATAVLVAKKAFQNFLVASPELAILAGIGLEIAASAIVASVSKTKAFAAGGIVTGPTNALIGEAGPEVVFPLDKLNQFIKGGTGNNRVEVVGQTIISGPNLITVLKRAQTNQGMV